MTEQRGIHKMGSFKTDFILDVEGLVCPMPIVKTKEKMNDLAAGQTLEVRATDRGTKQDLKAWAENAGHQYIGTIEKNGVYKHYLRKLSNNDLMEKKHSKVVNNEELKRKLAKNENIIIVDVREEAEYAFHHIPNAISIPMGELEDRIEELNQNDEIYVICRTGNRSDLVAQKLTDEGFANVINVVPGMSEWSEEGNI